MSNKSEERANTSEGIILNSDISSPSINDILSSETEKKVIDNLEKLQDEDSDKKIMDFSGKDSERVMIDKNSKNNKNIKETESLKDKNKKSSFVVQMPQSIGSNNINNNTLNESVYSTINRDFKMIYTKLKYVINPFISREEKYKQIRQWDLWCPLFLNILLSSTLSLNTEDKSQIITLIFIIFWFGGVAIFLNNYFLGVKTSLFQILCLLGYCQFPLNIAAIILTIINFNYIVRLIIVAIFFCWSTYSSSDYLKAITKQDKRYLVLYPCILFYLFLSWFIFATRR